MTYINAKARAEKLTAWLATMFPSDTRIECQLVDHSLGCGDQRPGQYDRLYSYRIESGHRTLEIDVTELAMKSVPPADLMDEIRCDDALLAPPGVRVQLALERGKLVSHVT